MNYQNNKLPNIDLSKVSYTDFIGLVNQWNVPPGAYSTISKWKLFSNLNNLSRILEIACTTGFSSRELALLTNCKGIGIDISPLSINAAILNKSLYAPEIGIEYLVNDAYEYNPKKLFSHIILGSSLGFFPEPQKLLDRIPSLLCNNGYILASPFYTNKKIPDTIVHKAKEVFGITITTQTYKEIISLYSDFEIIFEEKNIITKETDEEIIHYCNATLKKLERENPNLAQGNEQLIINRLKGIKEMSNSLRPFQGYSVLVLRYREHSFKNRVVELF